MTRLRWQYLLFVLPSAGVAAVLSATCTRPSRRCFALTTPTDVLIATIGGAAAGLAVGLLLIWAWTLVDRRDARLARRFPDSLILSATADYLTAEGARQLGLQLSDGATVVLVVGARGIQFWDGHNASRLLLDARWPQVYSIGLGQARGDMGSATAPQSTYIYDRLAIEASHDGRRAYLQFPVAARGAGSNPGLYCDAYDLRMLSRQINGYKSVHDRDADTKRG